MFKLCTSCGSTKPTNLFNKNKAKKDGLSNNCKECNKSYLKKHYTKNKPYYAEKRDRNRDSYREAFYQYLKGKSCKSCGITDIRVLEFDHTRDKSFNISKKVSYTPLDTLMKEIEKCDILCANCHRIKTSEQLGWFKNEL